ncbi:response regulator [Methylorubrum extorquens]|uniref:Response regulator receiver protein n=1 Tax=Methylorubrum extorquens (strain CM4 / NCIMB 13688) TaxID=440085 RepID=B7L1Q6_METC4|nr:response regulator [Methylorubrum extorquens]ACK81450.1 response regulator receiver protein [Methylorubrum extorquens CM4]
MQQNPSASPAPILVVEDDDLVRMVAVDMLEGVGFEVTEADTADAAWSLLEKGCAFGALFTDIDMPGSMDGLTLAGRVAERWPRIRLVVTSGRYGLRDADMPDDGRFLLKPYRQDQLLEAIAAAA